MWASGRNVPAPCSRVSTSRNTCLTCYKRSAVGGRGPDLHENPLGVRGIRPAAIRAPRPPSPRDRRRNLSCPPVHVRTQRWHFRVRGRANLSAIGANPPVWAQRPGTYPLHEEHIDVHPCERHLLVPFSSDEPMRTCITPTALLLLAGLACGGSDEQAGDTAGTDPGVTPAAPTATLTAAQLEGRWNGITRAAGTDSVLARWTSSQSSDSTFVVVFQDGGDSSTYTRRFDADSMIATSQPYARPSAPQGLRVITRSIGRLQADGRLVGTTTNMLADRPDSVIGRGRFEATRAP